MGNIVKAIIATIALTALAGCGSNTSSDPAVPKTSINYDFSPANIETTIDATSGDITVVATCNAEDLFEGTCYISQGVINIPGVTNITFPIGKNLVSGQKMTITIPLFNPALSELAPFSYLNDLNPSTSNTGWTIYSEVIGQLTTSSAGRGGDTCQQTQTPTPTPPPIPTPAPGSCPFTVTPAQNQTVSIGNPIVMDILLTDTAGTNYTWSVTNTPNWLGSPSFSGTKNNRATWSATPTVSGSYPYIVIVGNDTCNATITGTIIVPEAPTQPVCTSTQEFTTTLPPYTPGALRITDGTQNLDEKDFGSLSGSGTGKIRNNIAEFRFTNAPQKGSYLTAMFLSPLLPLSHVPLADDVKIIYNTLKLTQQGTILNDSTGQTYATISGNQITAVRPFGYSATPLVATYSGAPFSAYGGEVVGIADGVSKSYTLKTQYPLIFPGSLKSFTEKQPGTVQAYDQNGKFIVSFDKPPAKGESIKASYSITNVTERVEITIYGTPNGTSFIIPLSIGRATK